MLQGEHSAILLTFIKLPFVIKIFVLSILEWPLKTGYAVVYYSSPIRPFFACLDELRTRKALNSLHAGLFFMLLLWSVDFFHN